MARDPDTESGLGLKIFSGVSPVRQKAAVFPKASIYFYYSHVSLVIRCFEIHKAKTLRFCVSCRSQNFTPSVTWWSVSELHFGELTRASFACFRAGCWFGPTYRSLGTLQRQMQNIEMVSIKIAWGLMQALKVQLQVAFRYNSFLFIVLSSHFLMIIGLIVEESLVAWSNWTSARQISFCNQSEGSWSDKNGCKSFRVWIFQSRWPCEAVQWITGDATWCWLQGNWSSEYLQKSVQQRRLCFAKAGAT